MTGTGPNSGSPSYRPVGALLSGLSVLRYVAGTDNAVPLSRITRDLNLNPSTCLNILRTLAHEGYIVVDPRTKRYTMGLGVLELITGAVAQGGDLRAIRILTDAIAAQQGVTITLWRRVRRDRMTLVLESLPSGNVSIKMNLGQRLPLLIGAAGRLMAIHSGLSEAELKTQFQQMRMERPISFRDFMAEARLAAERGWATDEGQYTMGAASVAVPVLDQSGEAAYAFTATMFAALYSTERAETLASELERPAALLASALPFLS